MATNNAAAALDRPRKMLSASIGKSESTRASGKELSDHEIGRRFGRDVERAMEIAGITPQEAVHVLKYANQSPISKLINPTDPPAIAKMIALVNGFKAAWIEVLADGCPEWEREVTLRRRTGA